MCVRGRGSGGDTGGGRESVQRAGRGDRGRSRTSLLFSIYYYYYYYYYHYYHYYHYYYHYYYYHYYYYPYHGRRHIFVTRAPQLSGRRHIFVTPVAAVSLLRFSTCALVCPRIFVVVFIPGVFVTDFHAPISMACRDTLYTFRPIVFCSSTWSNFSINRIATATSSRDISAQTTVLLLSALSIALTTRTKSLNLLPIAPVRWTA